MSTLPDELFSLVERSTLAARKAAESAAQAALNTLSVNRPAPNESMDEGARQLRRALRAKARQLGGGSQIQGLQPLVEEIGYQQWHRMLFARFLAENDLLMHPTGVPVTLQDCAELAPEEDESDAWAVAAKYASEMLPGIFRRDDPVVQLRFAPEGRQELERILGEMQQIVFQADDSLGWMYQFWQSKKKEEVNASGRKIGGADLAPVTQLFTEDYMVRFLLENSLGAWWAARHPDSPLIQEWEYLRFKDNSEPAAGNFPGWPEDVAEVTIMDPCCGSGHFLVAAFEMLRKMRMEAEYLDETQAADAVIRDNLFGLEIDPRCTQIAAFALALVAWKTGGYRELPIPNIACSGIPVEGQLTSWLELAREDLRLKNALSRLYKLFKDAPTLGSLINPSDLPPDERMFTSDFEQVEPLLQMVLSTSEKGVDPTSVVFGSVARGVAGASKLLSQKYYLVATNVPYLGFKKQENALTQFAEKMHPSAKMDLATVFVERCRQFTFDHGTYAIVTPQNWLFIRSYRKMRKHYLNEQTWKFISWLGPGAFTTISGEVVKPVLLLIDNHQPTYEHIYGNIDASMLGTAKKKSTSLQSSNILYIEQQQQLNNPDYRITTSSVSYKNKLSDFATSSSGMSTSDGTRFYKYFWEVDSLDDDWEYLQRSSRDARQYGGRSHLVFWQKDQGDLYNLAQSLKHRNHAVQNWRRGQDVWNSYGVAINRMTDLSCALYTGNLYDESVAVIVPKNPDHLKAVWEYCKSPEYHDAVRQLDKRLGVMPRTLIKVPFDVEYWQSIALDADPFPELHSNDPTQWIFDGNLEISDYPLQVAVITLLGFRWPEQVQYNNIIADKDGIVCLPPIGSEHPANERLRVVLKNAYKLDWSTARQDGLLADVEFSGKTLENWLRDGFFKQHCKVFYNRPFIWHIWDGHKDGFHALVNYHKLDAVTLDRLIYTYLGSWIKLQRDKRDLGEPGADGRLVAALELQEKLEAIREGEAYPEAAPPNQKEGYDIYVRWKSLAEQPIGWNPDLNDGVRLNIRPFVTAGVLRNKFTINWKKDRGKNPDGSERHNDLHYTIAEKKAARGI